MDTSIDTTICRCCGMKPAWFGDATWCLCEPLPVGMTVFGLVHECTADRRIHAHRFTTLIAEETCDGRRVATVFHCHCGQEQRLELSARGI